MKNRAAVHRFDTGEHSDDSRFSFGNDTEQTFMLMEIDGDNLTFNAINRKGAVID